VSWSGAYLSPTLLRFIHRCIPTYEAAELLLFVVANSHRDFSVDEAVMSMRPTAVTASAVRKYVGLFSAHGLIADTHGRFRYCPVSSELERGVGELAHAYNERPVTLIRAIYHIGDSKTADGSITSRTS
jgi:hypothetical protein